MTFAIDTTWLFTEEAWPRVKHLVDRLSIPSIPIDILPIAGDLLSFPGLETLIFVVISRRFSYQDSEHLEVSLLLDIAVEDRPQKTFELVHSTSEQGESSTIPPVRSSS